jgi:cell wall assembly regulator SMI1
MMTVSALWFRLEAWLSRHTPSLAKGLNEGVSLAEIEAAETDLGFQLPEELRTSLQIHNGGPVANGLVGNWDLLSLDNMLSMYWYMESQRARGHFGPNETLPNGRVKGYWWHRYWFPIVGDTDGNFLCLDLDPERGAGSVGQVILFLADDGDRHVIASHYAKWLDSICQGLEAGRFAYRYDEDLDVYVWEQPGLIEAW